jgi:thiamine biosynthesis lipoprotein
VQRSELIRDEFAALGTTVLITVVLDAAPRPGEVERFIRRRVDDLERQWSRFIPSSEICAVNRCAGQWVAVGPATLRLVSRAVEAWRLTGGAFDPTILPALEANGYDRSFEDLPVRPPTPSAAAGAAPGCAGVEVAEGAVRLPPGVALDPGGIGKGLLGDLLVEELLQAGAAGACLEVGGDVRVAGRGPEDRGWVIGVSHPDPGAGQLARLWLQDGAVSSTSTRKRRWTAGGHEVHHVIDPVTGHPTAGPLGACVVAGAGWLAEALSTAVTVTGCSGLAEEIGGSALVVSADGAVQRSAGFASFEA